MGAADADGDLSAVAVAIVVGGGFPAEKFG
jgi:hypothetical protein